MSAAVIEIGVAATASTVVATSVDASPLWTALISLGVTIVTVVGAELVKFLVAFFKKKTEELENKNSKDKQDKKEEKQ
ncbi:MAG: hypothetical protein J6T10_00920 [Methanobrevibacter sp.]|nr:hypothetical protein [Methanobrevibacter sp.]